MASVKELEEFRIRMEEEMIGELRERELQNLEKQLQNPKVRRFMTTLLEETNEEQVFKTRAAEFKVKIESALKDIAYGRTKLRQFGFKRQKTLKGFRIELYRIRRYLMTAFELEGFKDEAFITSQIKTREVVATHDETGELRESQLILQVFLSPDLVKLIDEVKDNMLEQAVLMRSIADRVKEKVENQMTIKDEKLIQRIEERLGTNPTIQAIRDLLDQDEITDEEFDQKAKDIIKGRIDVKTIMDDI